MIPRVLALCLLIVTLSTTGNYEISDIDFGFFVLVVMQPANRLLCWVKFDKWCANKIQDRRALSEML